MSNRTAIFLSVLLAALLGGLFFALYEYYEEEQDTGWSKEALRNPFLAAQIYNEQQGYSVVAEDSYLKLESLDEFQTILVASSGQIISDKRLDEIIAWVDRGGHLIVAAQKPTEKESDRLFEYLDIEVFDTEFTKNIFDEDYIEEELFADEESKAQEAIESTKAEAAEEPGQSPGSQEKPDTKQLSDLEKSNRALAKQGIFPAGTKNGIKTEQEEVADYESSVPQSELTVLSFDGVDGDLRIMFDLDLSLSHPAFEDDYWEDDTITPTYWRGSDYGTHFLQLQHGDGLISVLAGSKPFESRQIIYFEHAFLWQVLASSDNVAILYGVKMPSLWFMLRLYMPEVLIAFFFFVIAWIWHKRLRFGPVGEQIVTVRRSSAEHIAASAAYTWRGEWQQQLLQPVRDAIKQEAEKKVAAYEQADDKTRLALLAQTAGVSVSHVEKAMHSKEKQNEDTFYQTVRLLQRIRESL
ncbi:protein of unknown function [Alteromonadaceae bacterium Bs31]|nr:protein of unknown function [Alteromonadaceae bacterium Bs31]